MRPEIDIDDKHWYAEKAFPKYPDVRTRERLIEIKSKGFVETGLASFGIEGVCGGLYIEKVWYLNNEGWKSYIDWAVGLAKEKNG
mgnify:CR=1 FL=1|tara:strand:- start:13205 stop:13459 length:255 start_codon:yes stop_codon:yes gene_type:complete